MNTQGSGKIQQNTSQTTIAKDDKSRVAKIARHYGKDLFAGHEINWTQLGSTWWKQTKNYIRSWYDKDYAQIVRDEFFNYWAKTLNNINTHDEMKDHLHHLSKISDEDIPEIKKMELIIKAAEKAKSFTNIPPPQENITYFNKATDYFNNQKQTILLNMEKAFTEHPPTILENNKWTAALTAVKSMHDKENPKSKDDLKELKMNYARALISKAIEFMGADKDDNDDIVDAIKTNLDKFFTNPGIGLLEKDKQELEAELDKQKLIYDMTQDGYLTLEEKNEFLEKPEIKQITNYTEFKSELYRQYPQTNYYNHEQFKKLKEFKKLIHDRHINENINQLITAKLSGDLSLEQSINATSSVINKNEINTKGHDDALKLYILEVKRNKQIDNDIQDKDEQKKFFEENPEFKFILDEDMFRDFLDAIKDFNAAK